MTQPTTPEPHDVSRMTAIRRKLRGLAGQEPPPHLDEHLHRVPDIYAEPAWNDLGDDRWKTSADLHKPV